MFVDNRVELVRHPFGTATPRNTNTGIIRSGVTRLTRHSEKRGIGLAQRKRHRRPLTFIRCVFTGQETVQLRRPSLSRFSPSIPTREKAVSWLMKTPLKVA